MSKIEVRICDVCKVKREDDELEAATLAFEPEVKGVALKVSFNVEPTDPFGEEHMDLCVLCRKRAIRAAVKMMATPRKKDTDGGP